MSIRPPIVVVMGHIDHGKSTLLDHIRHTNVVATEAGGITQATSAYQAELPERSNSKITFLDTPGHEAFAGMRERGAAIADIAILVVSAEEGVKAQTIEALNDILAAKLPYIVAINKIDRPNANPQLVKQQLAEKGVLLEGYGGTVPVAEISAKTGAGVPELLDLLMLLAELQNLESDPKVAASGLVLESHLDARAGISATLVIRAGSLALGDWVVIGKEVNKIKRLNNFKGEAAKELPPSAPAIVVGLSSLPPVGAEFRAYPDKKAAEKAAEQAKLTASKKVAQAGTQSSSEAVEIPVAIKGDVTGSVEAVEREVLKLNSQRARLKIISASVGRITDNDIKLASGQSGTMILGFNTPVDASAQDLAAKLNVEIATFEIIYKLSEWLAEEIHKRLPKVEELRTLGKVKLLKLFGSEKDKQVVGGVVTSGRMVIGKPVKILRRENEVGRGKVVELQEQKLPTREVEQDHQFGAMVESKLPLAAGDVLEVFEIVER